MSSISGGSLSFKTTSSATVRSIVLSKDSRALIFASLTVTTSPGLTVTSFSSGTPHFLHISVQVLGPMNFASGQF